MKVTIALSVYNVDKYLRDALDDIVNQTYPNLEIICIDDASTDDTWNILKEYSEKDKRIRLIKHSHNMGLSVSRNESIDAANGEYLIMLDGDDRFCHSMVEDALDCACHMDADVVIWDYATFSKDSELLNSINQGSRLNPAIVKDRKLLLELPGFIWIKLFRTEILKKMNIRFAIGLTKQDIPVHWRIATEFDKIAILPKKLVHYRINHNATSTRRDKSLFSLAKVMDIVGEQLRNDGIYYIYRNEYLRRRLSLLHGMYDFVTPELKSDALLMVCERFDEDARLFLKENGNCLSSRTKNFYKMIQGDFIAKIRYTLFLFARSLYRRVTKR